MHIESRRSKRRDSEFEIYVDIDCSDKEKMSMLLHLLRYGFIFDVLVSGDLIKFVDERTDMK